MKRLLAVAVGLFLSTSLIVAANAAPAAATGKQNVPQGLKNARKAMQGKLEQDKKRLEVQKKGQAKRHQSQGKK
ncbi:MAG: hypothetical protein GJV46_09680 [Geobacter sp.]|nr:hypothetical protein [Geobacter sp.]